jgi:hypothetical protein
METRTIRLESEPVSLRLDAGTLVVTPSRNATCHAAATDRELWCQAMDSVQRHTRRAEILVNAVHTLLDAHEFEGCDATRDDLQEILRLAMSNTWQASIDCQLYAELMRRGPIAEQVRS